MFGLFKSVIDLTTDVAKIVAAPVTIVVDVVGAGVKPIAEVVEELSDDIKDALK